MSRVYTGVLSGNTYNLGNLELRTSAFLKQQEDTKVNYSFNIKYSSQIDKEKILKELTPANPMALVRVSGTLTSGYL